jgi:hypothetical protein
MADVILVPRRQNDEVRVTESHVVHLGLVLRVVEPQIGIFDVAPAQNSNSCSAMVATERIMWAIDVHG